MTKLVVRLLLAAILIGAGGTVRAEDGNWQDEAELTLVDTGGNTEVTTFSLRNVLTVPFSERTKGTWKLGALYGKSDGMRNAESYSTELRGDHILNGLYTFGYGGWFQDRFGGIAARYYIGSGAGTRFLNGPEHFLLGEAGLSFTREEYTDDTDDDFPGGRLFGKYEYRFTKQNRFSQSLEWLPDLGDTGNWNLVSDTALVSALNSWLSMKASCVVKYDNEPVDALKKTDRILGVSLIVNF